MNTRTRLYRNRCQVILIFINIFLKRLILSAPHNLKSNNSSRLFQVYNVWFGIYKNGNYYRKKTQNKHNKTKTNTTKTNKQKSSKTNKENSRQEKKSGKVIFPSWKIYLRPSPLFTFTTTITKQALLKYFKTKQKQKPSQTKTKANAKTKHELLIRKYFTEITFLYYEIFAINFE